MKRALMTFSLSILGCMLVGSAHAQVGSPPEEAKYFRIPNKFHLFVELGGSLPSNPGVFNDLWNSAFQFGAGGGMNVISWLDVNANFTYASWENNSTDSKSVIGFVGVPDVEGGLITTMTFSGSARFVAVPSARTNPFAEFSVGYYQTSADPLTIEGVLSNTMEDCSGMMIAPALGVQYALADSWGAYAKYSYVYCSSSEFAPGDLLRPQGGGEPAQGDDEIFQTITVGVMLRF